MACEVDMITQYLLQILGYYFEFKVCPMSAADIGLLFQVQSVPNVFYRLKERCPLMQIV